MIEARRKRTRGYHTVRLRDFRCYHHTHDGTNYVHYTRSGTNNISPPAVSDPASLSIFDTTGLRIGLNTNTRLRGKQNHSKTREL